MTRNELFYKVMVGLFVIVLLIGLGTMAAVLWTDSETIVIRIIGLFAGTLTAAVGFASGYLLAQRNGNGNGNGNGK